MPTHSQVEGHSILLDAESTVLKKCPLAIVTFPFKLCLKEFLIDLSSALHISFGLAFLDWPLNYQIIISCFYVKEKSKAESQLMLSKRRQERVKVLLDMFLEKTSLTFTPL